MAASSPTPLSLHEPLPWHDPIWGRLCNARAAERLPHALLFVGPRGVGKRQLVAQLTSALLCATPDSQGRACARCADCRLVDAGSHPDLTTVAPDPESKSGEIPIEPIRELAERTALTPARATRKLVVIDPADRMNAAAANALLKTLEEPAGAALVCLIAEQPARLPATIRSRCQWVRVAVPPESQALVWLGPRLGLSPQETATRLQLAQGAPLRALREIDATFLDQRRELFAGLVAIARGERDPVSVAAAWNGFGARLSLECVAVWLCDLLRLKAAGEPPRLADPDVRDTLSELACRADGAAVHRFLRRTLDCRALADANLNSLLMLESLTIEWSLASRAASGSPGGRAA